MKKLTKSEKEDYRKYYLETPDADFSPARNKAIVEGTIKKYEAMQAKKRKAVHDPILERADAVSSFLKSFSKTMSTGKSRTLDNYFGKKYLNYLRGVDIQRELYARMQIYNDKGQLIKLNF